MIMLRKASSNRRQPLLQGSHGGSRKAGTQLGEAVGGAAAVCCCCPCGLANIMFLAIYKLPASLCRRALKLQKQRRRQRLANKEGMYPARHHGCSCGCGCGDDYGAKVHPSDDGEMVSKVVKAVDLEEEEEDMDVVKLEKEMWEKFYSTGFWRSCSQREDSSPSFSSSSSQKCISIVSVSNLQVHDASIL